MKKFTRRWLTIFFCSIIVCMSITVGFSQSLAKIATANKNILTITTLFTAHDVRGFLSTPAGLDNAVNWCKQTGITKVYIETFRDGYYANREILVAAQNRFLSEGFKVSGCVATTRVKKPNVGGWSSSCFTNIETQDELQRIFEYTASIFDEIMIDDFLFNDCRCSECVAARADQTWSDYNSDLMVKLSQERILKPAKKVNPNVKIIIKYPNWYDQFQRRGYDVARQTRDYDFIYVGTETREYNYAVRSSGKVQYAAYFLMRWLGGIGGNKTGGGWFDALGTQPETYLEQARQTVLAGAKELMLFCYSNLVSKANNYDGWDGTGIANVEAFRKELPGLLELAKIVRGKPIKGIQLPKPSNSDPLEETDICSILGMLGLPLVPVQKIDEKADASIFTLELVNQPNLSGSIKRMLDNGKSVVITDDLLKNLPNQNLENNNLTVIKVGGDPKNLLKLTREELKPIRDKLLAPMGLKFDAPNKVGLYLLGDNIAVMENFNDQPVDVQFDYIRVSKVQKVFTLPENGTAEISQNKRIVNIRNISPRTLVVVMYR